MMNVVCLEGRLTRDPEVRFTQNQLAVCKFTLAVDRQFKKEGQPQADFISITVWGKTAENVGKYMGKGRLVSVAGRIQTRSWDGEDGKKQYATEVVAESVNFLDKAPEGQNAPSGDGFVPVDDPALSEDLPF